MSDVSREVLRDVFGHAEPRPGRLRTTTRRTKSRTDRQGVSGQ
jgi:hypothetical protein